MPSNAERDFLASNIMFELLCAVRAKVADYERRASQDDTGDAFWQLRLANARTAYAEGMKIYSNARVAKIMAGEACQNPGEGL